jgi:O-antigen ligase
VERRSSAIPGGGWGGNAPLAAFVVLLVLCMLGGGASRADVASLVYVRPAAILTIGFLLLMPGRKDYRLVRVPLILLGAFALVMLLQLVPLPPGLWASLPGHGRYLDTAAGSAGAALWRPLSLTPDMTINSLITLAFPLAGLLAYAAMQAEQRARLLHVILLAACASALFGIVQVTGNPRGPAFLYNITHEGSSVGFFANRNHQAALLATAFPMLRVWTLLPHPDPSYRRMRVWVALGIAVLLVPLLLITGSRAGILLAVVGWLAAYLLTPRRSRSRRGRWAAARTALFFAIPVGLTAAVVLLGRALSIERLTSLSYLATETRFEYTPITLAIARDFFPFGTGFGAFDPVFRGYEPDSILGPQYFNHAHNELIELAITGGLPALLLFLILLGWLIRQTLRAVRRRYPDTPVLLARLGAVMILMFFLASLVDYPLRTPLLSLVFAVLCGWLCEASRFGEPGAQAAPEEGEAARQ